MFDSIMNLSRNGKALVIIVLFNLSFGGFLVWMDLYRFNDAGSATTVLIIYVLTALFAALFLSGKPIGLKALIGLEVFFIIMQTIFVVASLSQVADAGLHNPVDNWWTAILQYLFNALTLIFAVRTYKELAPILAQKS